MKMDASVGGLLGPAAAQTPQFDARSTTSPEGHLWLGWLVLEGATMWRTRRKGHIASGEVGLRIQHPCVGRRVNTIPTILFSKTTDRNQNRLIVTNDSRVCLGNQPAQQRPHDINQERVL